MTLVARYYENESQAQNALAALQENGYEREAITYIAPLGADAEGNVDSAAAAAMAVEAGALLGDAADRFLGNMEKGYHLVGLKPGFGLVLLAAQVLDRFDPVDAAGEGAEPGTTYRPFYEQPAPLSAALRWQTVLKKPRRTTESLGFKMLSGNRSYFTRDLASSDWSLSAKFGWPLLKSEAAPLSSMLGMSTLKQGKSGDSWSSSFGFKMLSDHPTPLSSFFGIPLISGDNDSRSYSPMKHRSGISQNPAPLSNLLGLGLISKKRQTAIGSMFPLLSKPSFAFSSMLGMPLLSSNPAPLSSMLGMSTKSGKSGDSWQTSFGMPLLSSNPTPFSSMLGMPVKSDQRSMYH